MSILKDFSNNVPQVPSEEDPENLHCGVVLKDCVGLVGECNIVTNVEDCNTYVRDPNSEIPVHQKDQIIVNVLHYLVARVEQITKHLDLPDLEQGE